MEFAEVVRRRRMVRRYRPDPVDPAALERIVTTALRGPSAGFAQGVSLVVVTNPERRAAVAAACGEPAATGRGLAAWLSVAPVQVLVCVSDAVYRARYGEVDKASARRPELWQPPYWWVDGGAAVMLVLLAAVNEGLAAGVMGVERAKLADILELDEDQQPVLLVTIGHPAADERPVGSAVRRRRRPTAEVVRYIT